MKIKKHTEGYVLTAENDRENEIISVLVNLIDYSKIPKDKNGVHIEGCYQKNGTTRNFLAVPFWDDLYPDNNF